MRHHKLYALRNTITDYWNPITLLIELPGIDMRNTVFHQNSFQYCSD